MRDNINAGGKKIRYRQAEDTNFNTFRSDQFNAFLGKYIFGPPYFLPFMVKPLSDLTSYNVPLMSF
jgi:hypothetical protein